MKSGIKSGLQRSPHLPLIFSLLIFHSGPRSSSKHARNRRRAGCTAGWRQSIHIFDRAQHVEVVDLMRVLPALNVCAVKEGWYLIAFSRRSGALIPCDDQQAVVPAGPSGVTIQVLLEPSVTHLDRVAVHVVDDVGDHE